MFEYRFMQLSLAASFLISIISAVIGTFIVLRRMTSAAGAISHAAFGGMGAGLLMGINPVYAAIPFTVGVAAIFSWFKKSMKISEESVLSIIWSFGMSLGIILMNFKKGYTGEILGYLFGSVLAIGVADLALLAFTAVFISALFILLSREFVLLSFDEEFAYLKGINTRLLDLIFYSLTALSVVVLIKSAGVLVIVAFLTVPPIIAKRFAGNISSIILLSFLLNLLFSFLGMAISFYFDVPAGPAMVMISILVLSAVAVLRKS